MKTREQALKYGLSFPDTCQDAPFKDTNWQAELLLAEGIEVVDGRVELKKYQME